MRKGFFNTKRSVMFKQTNKAKSRSTETFVRVAQISLNLQINETGQEIYQFQNLERPKNPLQLILVTDLLFFSVFHTKFYSILKKYFNRYYKKKHGTTSPCKS